MSSVRKTVMLFRPCCTHVLPLLSSPFRVDIFPLSIAHIVSVLEKGGFKVSVADPADLSQYAPKEIIRRIIKEKPSVVGISCFTANRFACREIAEIVKRIDKKITVVFGGVLPTFLYGPLLAGWPVDIVVPYEGEEVFLRTCAALAKGSDLDKVDGIVYMKEGVLVKTAFSSPITDLDSLPLPAYHHFKLNRDNIFGLFTEAVPVMRIDTSRGCPGRCSFCSTVEMWHRRVRYFSLERVLKEIQLVKRRFKVRVFAFTDINFATNTKRIQEFCRRLISEKTDIEWVCTTRADGRLSESDFSLMKQSGCRMIQFGVESLSERVLKSINKGIDVETQVRSLHNAYNSGIAIGINLILGFPGETEDMLVETLRAVERNIPPVHDFDVERLNLEPGSIIYQQEVHAGRFKEESWLNPENIWRVYEPSFVFSRRCDHYKKLIEAALRVRLSG